VIIPWVVPYGPGLARYGILRLSKVIHLRSFIAPTHALNCSIDGPGVAGARAGRKSDCPPQSFQ
jgi:hypothetical protein